MQSRTQGIGGINNDVGHGTKMWLIDLHLRPYYEDLIQPIRSDIGYKPAQFMIVRPYSIYLLLKGLTPVDPAGPDCYQNRTKPCEST